MKRRTFIESAAAAAVLTPAVAGCGGGEQGSGSSTQTGGASKQIGQLGGKSVAEVRHQYEYDLFEDFVPFHSAHVFEPTYGGFLASTDHDGSHPETNTNASYMGRGIWCFSFLYNNLEKDTKYLDMAWQAVQFIMKHRPSGENFWPGSYTMEGDVINVNGGYAGDCYIAEGLAEFSKATGDPQYMTLAKETMAKCLRHYDRPDFKDGSTPYPGARSLWYLSLIHI